MVEGLDRFAEHFADHIDQYILIGGAACTLAMNEAGLEFRATKDLDIVLCVEVLDESFAASFWEFVASGEYKIQEKATGEKRFYRFHAPGVPGYPYMLELFSRVPDALTINDESHLTPIPLSDTISSLSAILLDGSYYDFLRSGRRVVSGVPFVGPEHLIPLKAKAWIDLKRRKAEGERIDSRSIKKHKNDVFRLYAIIDPDFSAEMPASIKADLAVFIDGMESEDVSLKSLGLQGETLESVLAELRRIYAVE